MKFDGRSYLRVGSSSMGVAVANFDDVFAFKSSVVLGVRCFYLKQKRTVYIYAKGVVMVILLRHHHHATPRAHNLVV